MSQKEPKFKVGETLKDDKRNMTITAIFYKDRTRKNYVKGETYTYKERWYNYICHNCGWTNGVIPESNLSNGNGCACCHSLVVVEGINDIPTTAPWMIPYFQGGYDEAKQYTYGSDKRFVPRCPDCGQIKDKSMAVTTLYQTHSIGCTCGDGISYPEKFIFNLLQQLKICNIRQLSKAYFSWCGKYKYDFYLPDYNCIIETHGMQHYKEGINFRNNAFEEIQKNDRAKQELALNNKIEKYIALDCSFSSCEYIKNSILNSQMALFLPLELVDWNQCAIYAHGNLFQKACALKKENELYSTGQIGKILNLDDLTIRTYLKRGRDLGLCFYDEKLEQERNIERHKNGKKVVVFDQDMNKLNTFASLNALEKNSLELYGCQFYREGVQKAAKNKVLYHDYYFEIEC